jgi:hypothetical protein
MIGTLKLAGIAVVAVILAYVGGRLQGYQSGKEVGAASCMAANEAATAEKNKELKNSVEELRPVETRETEAAEKAGEVLILNPAPEDTCRLATPEEEQAFDQLGGNL